MIISMFKLHILLFYKAKSSILNIHDIQSYSYANMKVSTHLINTYIGYTKLSLKYICMYLNMIFDALR